MSAATSGAGLSGSNAAPGFRCAHPGYKISERPIAEDGAAAHHADQAGLVEAGGAMQRAAVVPHDALTRAPAMGVDAGRRRDHHVELLDQRAAVVVSHALDRLGMVAEEDRLAAGVVDGCARSDARFGGTFGFCSGASAGPRRGGRVREKSKLWMARRPSISGLSWRWAADRRRNTCRRISVSPPASGTTSEYIMVACPVRSRHGAVGVPEQRALVWVLAARIAVTGRGWTAGRSPGGPCSREYWLEHDGPAPRRNCARRPPASPAAGRRRGTGSAGSRGRLRRPWRTAPATRLPASVTPVISQPSTGCSGLTCERPVARRARLRLQLGLRHDDLPAGSWLS